MEHKFKQVKEKIVGRKIVELCDEYIVLDNGTKVELSFSQVGEGEADGRWWDEFQREVEITSMYLMNRCFEDYHHDEFIESINVILFNNVTEIARASFSVTTYELDDYAACHLKIGDDKYLVIES
ncbi:hypothetical protein NHG23_08740 [Aerococcaceae bacterium NML190073]|nr:hypothetical protein [Aerococcaceae bacterium NML190073]